MFNVGWLGLGDPIDPGQRNGVWNCGGDSKWLLTHMGGRNDRRGKLSI